MKFEISREWLERALLDYGDPEGCSVCGAIAGCCSTYPNCKGNEKMESEVKNELKPSVAQMLQIGYSCGLTTLEEAYSQYMSHYDCFFLIDKFHEQYDVFVQQLKDLGFTEQIDGINELISINLEACFKILGIEPEEYEELTCPPFQIEESSAQLFDIK